MTGIEFIETSREDLATHKEKETLAAVLEAAEQLIRENPTCEIDPKKTIEELWRQMKEHARARAVAGMYVFDPAASAKFIREYLGIGEAKLISLEDFL